MSRNRSSQSATAERRRARGGPATPPDHDGSRPEADPPSLIAYRVSAEPRLPLEPAPVERDWLDATRDRFGYRCLPMLIANQAGWYILNSHALDVVWNGQDDRDALKVTYRSGDPPYPAISHFGHGILTWQLPYLFRTPPGIQLLARGPANSPKDGISPLEGLIETDWNPATFTMNWQMTRPRHRISFEPGEPICMVVPCSMDLLERMQPEMRRVDLDPTLDQQFRTWTYGRTAFLRDLQDPDSAASAQGWQKDYFRGLFPDGARERSHRTRLRLNPFFNAEGTTPVEVNRITPADGEPSSS